MALTKGQKLARKTFVEMYGPEARNVVQYIARGWNSLRIADKFGISVTSVAAYRANVSRGTYVPFADVHCNGACNF